MEHKKVITAQDMLKIVNDINENKDVPIDVLYQSYLAMLELIKKENNKANHYKQREETLQKQIDCYNK